ncbi:hypothetical protein ACWT_6964 [Actinoplanes sp. SE50]|uniref:hypothetical protein n=1 Tax=unclassified Actinoplanes TaxID=2626549 RepID=UPI00023EC1A4|nr:MULTISPECIES: hypothetical protein [unclassified Actinoplanes]AEV87975.1 hypothetical protein ACPL_7095 [Actinoplanes sp. SE50/110]ATO86379.1 hypothetical protein ACWT_6964 [Actinoplanes sp. SE50]SLM03794.1 hypothetical protein ACSP50_7093 [Actinoplanes sp. SE50/110]
MNLDTKPKRIAYALLVIAALVLGWMAIFDGPLEEMPGPAQATLRFFFGIVAALLAAALIFVAWPQRLGGGPGRPKPDNPGDNALDDEIQRSIAAVAAKYKDNQAKVLFSKLLLDNRLLVRAYDEIQLLDQSLACQTSIDYALDRTFTPSTQGSSLIPVPVIEARKGTLLDSFEVVSADDAVVPTLPQSETRGLLAHAIIACYSKAYNVSLDELLDRSKRPLALNALLRMVYRRGRASDQASEQEFRGIVSGVILTSTPAARRFGSRLEQLCTYYSRHYLVAVDVPVDAPTNRVHLQYRQTLPIYGLVANFRERVRVRCGLLPYKFKIPMPLIYRAASYHFSMRGTSGQYVANHEVVHTAKQEFLRAEDMEGRYAACYLRLRYRTGLPYARLYSRGFARIDAKSQDPLASIVEFAEVPPGALGGVARVAMVTTALVAVFAFLRPSVTEVSSDAAALLLAAPAAMAAWVGYSMERVRQSSLATYVGLAITQFVSVASAMLYILERRQQAWAEAHLTLHDQGVVGIWTLPDVDAGWLLLGLVGGVTAVSLIVLRTVRTRVYLREVAHWNDIA